MNKYDDINPFADTVDKLVRDGFEVVEVERPIVQVGETLADAKKKLLDGIKWYFKASGRDFNEFYSISYTDAKGKTHNPYTEVSQWLHNNEGKSLMLYGGCGLGKTMIARYILPVILKAYSKRSWNLHTFNASELHKPEVYAEAMKWRCVCIDDVGVENKIVNYGQTIDPILEIVDSIEKRKSGRLVVFTTNLPNADAIEKRYGTRVLDRIRSNFKNVLFYLQDKNGNAISLRPK